MYMLIMQRDSRYVSGGINNNVVINGKLGFIVKALPFIIIRHWETKRMALNALMEALFL